MWTQLAEFFIIISAAGWVDYRARYCLQSPNMGARQPITSLSAHLMGEIKGTAQQEWMGLAIKILLMYDNVRDLIPPHLADVVPCCLYVCMYVCPCACVMTEMYGTITFPIHGDLAAQSHFTHSALLNVEAAARNLNTRHQLFCHSLSFTV